MTNPENNRTTDDIDNLIEQEMLRDELIEAYLNERRMTYGELVKELKKHGGEMVFNDSEQIAELCATFSAGKIVEFSEMQIANDYQLGVITEDSFAVPHASSDHKPALYRPYLCVTIEDTKGISDVILFSIALRSNGRLEVNGLKEYSTTPQA